MPRCGLCHVSGSRFQLPSSEVHWQAVKLLGTWVVNLLESLGELEVLAVLLWLQRQPDAPWCLQLRQVQHCGLEQGSLQLSGSNKPGVHNHC